jgi:iron complex outermembrane receptor protein
MSIKPKTAIAVLSFFITSTNSGVAQELEEIIVHSTPLPRTIHDSAQPVSVIEGDDLELKSGSTLGATLSSEPGVNATSFGPGASRPIIRGLGGDRIRVLENGVGSQDVSNTSPDHATAVEPLLADKIEVVRGPAAILYGTSAIGGVVNIIDSRIPDQKPDAAEGKFEIRGGTVDLERAGVGSVTAPVGNFAVNLDYSSRLTDDLKITGYARTPQLRDEDPDELGPRGTLLSSATDTQNASVGSSYFFEGGFLGASYSQYDSNYGLPNGEEDISIDMQRRRVDLRGMATDILPGIETAELKAGIVDYEHTEYEQGETGTIYKNNGADSRLDFTHGKLGPLTGSFGFQYQYSDLSATGVEAFIPPSNTNIGSFFVFEELPLAPQWSLQFGGRYDFTDVSANNYLGIESETPQSIDRSFDTFGETVGLVWKPLAGYSAALSVAHTERAPTQQELYSNGIHHATALYELGDPNLGKERSTGIDLIFRKTEGRITGSIGGFYNRFDDYINLASTGMTRSDGIQHDDEHHGDHGDESHHDESHHDEGHHDHEDFPVARYEAVPANFYGFESQVAFHLLEEDRKGEDLAFEVQTDYVWASNRASSEPLPRIPPLRIKLGLSYSHEKLGQAKLEYLQTFRQGRNAEFETETPQYSLLNLYLSRDIEVAENKFEIFARGVNLLDDKIREAASFTKDVAPLGGIGAVAGIRIKF